MSCTLLWGQDAPTDAEWQLIAPHPVPGGCGGRPGALPASQRRRCDPLSGPQQLCVAGAAGRLPALAHRLPLLAAWVRDGTRVSRSPSSAVRAGTVRVGGATARTTAARDERCP